MNLLAFPQLLLFCNFWGFVRVLGCCLISVFLAFWKHCCSNFAARCQGGLCRCVPINCNFVTFYVQIFLIPAIDFMQLQFSKGADILIC